MAEPSNIPLVADLDGTLIRTDMMWESLARLLRRNPLAIFQILYWWARGRAHLKQKLAERVQVDPADLPYHEPFLAWLRAEKQSGRKLILATASDLKMAEPVARHVGLFDEVLASDGRTNLRSGNKLRLLTLKFGERGFDYAGNSSADFAVWRGSRRAVVVNASPSVLQEAARCGPVDRTFCEGYSGLLIARRFVTELFWGSGYLVALIAGLLLALAFPHFSVAGFGWIAPALMVFAARQGRGGAEAFRSGYVAGFSFWLASLVWLLKMPVTGFPDLFLPALGWLSLCAYLAIYFGLWTWFVSQFEWKDSTWSGRLAWSISGAAAWVALEFLRGWFLTGFPWSYLGVSQFKLTPLIQLSSVTGVLGLSFLLVWFSLSLFSAAQRVISNPASRFVWQAEIALPLCAVLALYLIGFGRIHFDGPGESRHLRVTLVQPSEPQTLIWSAQEDSRRLTRLLAQSQSALTNGTDLLLWPESAVPPVDEAAYQAIRQFVRSNQVWLILNAEDAEMHPAATNFFNAAFLVSPDGRWLQSYHKRRLVIFGEYVPLANWLPFLRWLTPISGGWTPGRQAAQFVMTNQTASDADKVINIASSGRAPELSFRGVSRISPLICFEDVFPGLGRDSVQEDTDLLVNLTNDGWFGESAEQWQHAAAAVFRAVENSRPLLRCANNGVTCRVDSHGRILPLADDPSGDIHGRGVLTVEVALADAPQSTYYHRHGDWFGWSCVGLASLSGLRRLVSRPSRRGLG